MLNQKFSSLLIAVTILCAIATVAIAGPGSTPNGPWVTPDQVISLEAFHDYEQLTDQLMKIEKSSKGLVEVVPAGTTGGGRSIWLVKIGNSDNTPVLIFTQQHGDEPHGKFVLSFIAQSTVAI